MSWDDGDDDWDAPAADEDNSAPALTDKWDGEDEDDDCLLGDDWDADPDEKKEADKKVVPGVKKLTKRQLAKKKEEEERQAALKRAEAARKANDPQEQARLAAERQAAIAKSNLDMCKDLFGGDGYEAPPDGEFQSDQLDADNTDMIVKMAAADIKAIKVERKDPLENVELQSLDDFKKFGTQVAKILSKATKQKHVVEALKVVLTEATKKMSLDEANEIKKLMNVTCTKKQKDEAGKKKKNNKKAQLKMGNNDAFGDDDYGYDDMDAF
jgi:hypothetical protein